MLNINEIEDGIRVDIRVQPRSARNQIAGEYAGAVKIKLTAPPVDGEANQELIIFLSKLLKVSKSSIILLQGETGRNKTVEIKGINKSEFIRKAGL